MLESRYTVFEDDRASKVSSEDGRRCIEYGRENFWMGRHIDHADEAPTSIDSHVPLLRSRGITRITHVNCLLSLGSCKMRLWNPFFRMRQETEVLCQVT
jgi:hypothetical protein